MWFQEWFSNKYYLELYRHRGNEDARLMLNLLQRSITVNSGSKILDIACGAGRHSIELSRRGFDVTGFDLSKYLIGEARKELKRSPEQNLKVKFLIKDMRDFNFSRSFDVAVNIFTSFGYFEKDEENFKVIRNVSNSLKSGGYFVFDFLNKNYIEKNLIPYSKSKQGDITLIQKRRIEDGSVKKNIIIKDKHKTLNYTESLKLYSLKEFKNVFTSFKFRIQNLFGDYYGNKYNENKSQRLIIIAKKT